MKPSSKIIGSYRNQMPGEEPAEKKTAGRRALLEKVVPRKIKKNTSLRTTHKGKVSADPLPKLWDEQNRRDEAASIFTEANRDPKSSSSETTAEPDLIAVADYLHHEKAPSPASEENPVVEKPCSESNSEHSPGSAIQTSKFDEDLEELLAQVRNDGLESQEIPSAKYPNELKTWNPVTTSIRAGSKDYILTREKNKILGAKSDPKRHKFATTPKKERIEKMSMFAVANEKKAKLRLIRAGLPEGVNLDDNGKLSGTTHLIKTPKYQEGGLPQFSGREDMEFQEYFNQVTNDALNKNLAEVAGQKITTQAKSDFYRLDYELCYEDGNKFRSYDLDIPKEKEKARNDAVTLALRKFSGTDAATTVLSSILHQSTAATIARGLRSADGFAMEHLRMISALNTTGRTIYVGNDDGSRQQVADPLGLAGAKFRVSKQQNYFKISIEWQMYFEAKRDQEDLLPLGENEVIAVSCQAEFLVNGDMAHTVITDDGIKERNVMDLTIPDGGIRATFSGRLKLD